MEFVRPALFKLSFSSLKVSIFGRRLQLQCPIVYLLRVRSVPHNIPTATCGLRFTCDPAYPSWTLQCSASITIRHFSTLLGDVGGPDELFALTPAERTAVGAFCGNTFAAVSSPITSCANPNFGAKRLRIPAAGTGDDGHNPPRIVPRHVFDASDGTDNLIHCGEHTRVSARFTVMNFTNREALYNFQSNFSGTHFLTPRAYTASIGLVF